MSASESNTDGPAEKTDPSTSDEGTIFGSSAPPEASPFARSVSTKSFDDTVSESLAAPLKDLGNQPFTPEALDRSIAKLAVSRGLATDEEIDMCSFVMGEEKRDSLGEVLIERRALTPNQYERLRADVEAERTGQRIPGFRMLGKIGAGASATVFKARQLNLDRLVAIKKTCF